MKFDHSSDYISKRPKESFTVSYNFNSDLESSDAITAATVTITDVDGVDKTASMISNVATPSPNVSFTIFSGTAGKTYDISVLGVTTGANKYIGNVVCEVVGEVTLNTKLGDSSANSYVTLKEANDYIRNKYGHSDTWDTLSIEGRKRVLIQAARAIDRFNFIDEKYYDNQALSFPRDTHNTLSGKCATPVTINSFKNTSFTEDTYGSDRSNTDFWKYGAVHITAATPLYDIRVINTSSITTDVVSMVENFTATPTTNTSFIAFEPLYSEIKNAQIEQALFITRTQGKSTLQNYSSLAERVKIGDTEVYFKRSSGDSRQPLSAISRKMLSRWVDRTLKIQRG